MNEILLIVLAINVFIKACSPYITLASLGWSIWRWWTNDRSSR